MGATEGDFNHWLDRTWNSALTFAVAPPECDASIAAARTCVASARRNLDDARERGRTDELTVGIVAPVVNGSIGAQHHIEIATSGDASH